MLKKRQRGQFHKFVVITLQAYVYRKSLSFSKIDKWHNLAIGWFFWQFNLERQHYF